MNMARLTVAFGVAGLFLGLAGMGDFTVLAQSDTYEFTADSGQNTHFNGSTITIDGTGPTGVASFSFYDTSVSLTPFTSGTVETEYVEDYNASGWDGLFVVRTDGLTFTANHSNVYTMNPPGSWEYVPPSSSVPEPGTFSLLAAGAGAMVLWFSRRRSGQAGS
jgi:hypothetical protein